jgi:hypothetical protein
VEDRKIKDSRITASSVWSASLSTKQGRLNSASSWSARRNDQNQWIQADLGREEFVTAIATQGRANYNQWVKTYSVSLGSDGNTFEPYKIDGAVKVRNSNCLPVNQLQALIKRRWDLMRGATLSHARQRSLTLICTFIDHRQL